MAVWILSRDVLPGIEELARRVFETVRDLIGNIIVSREAYLGLGFPRKVEAWHLELESCVMLRWIEGLDRYRDRVREAATQ